MTAGELMAELAGMDPEIRVIIPASQLGYFDVSSISRIRISPEAGRGMKAEIGPHRDFEKGDTGAVDAVLLVRQPD